MEKFMIKVSMTADDNHKLKPYFWCLLKLKDDTWVNAGFGWDVDPHRAWDEATTYFRNIKT